MKIPICSGPGRQNTGNPLVSQSYQKGSFGCHYKFENFLCFSMNLSEYSIHHAGFRFTTQDRRLIITNAYRKHSQQMTKEDLEKLKVAIHSRREYLRRVKEGIYYES